MTDKTRLWLIAIIGSIVTSFFLTASIPAQQTLTPTCENALNVVKQCVAEIDRIAVELKDEPSVERRVVLSSEFEAIKSLWRDALYWYKENCKQL